MQPHTNQFAIIIHISLPSEPPSSRCPALSSRSSQNTRLSSKEYNFSPAVYFTLVMYICQCYFLLVPRSYSSFKRDIRADMTFRILQLPVWLCKYCVSAHFLLCLLLLPTTRESGTVLNLVISFKGEYVIIDRSGRWKQIVIKHKWDYLFFQLPSSVLFSFVDEIAFWENSTDITTGMNLIC